MRTAAALLLLSLAAAAQEPAPRRLPLAVLRDRIAGGWAGQMIGVSFGAPTEFRWRQRLIPAAELPPWAPERVANAVDQDDLYVEMTFLAVLAGQGWGAGTADFGAAFRESRYPLWHANLAARRALRRGVPAALAGTPGVNVHYEDIDFQIEADFAGLVAPGLPRTACELALRAGRVMNAGDGLLGGVFVAGMYAAAFFAGDPREAVAAGLASLPPGSGYARVVGELLARAAAAPGDWEGAWRLVGERWDRDEACPAGALRPFNIDAKLNGAYIAIGLLYGGGDFGRTLEIATRCGQDSDCNPANAGGVLGTMLGLSGIPERWRAGLSAVAGKKFRFTEYSFGEVLAVTEKLALDAVAAAGGRREGEELLVPVQAPAPVAVARPARGKPVERIDTGDARWRRHGAWRPGPGGALLAAQRGAEAAVEFAGTGAILCGPYLPDGGLAEVYLDGRLDRRVDVDSDGEGVKGGEAVWHRFDLPPGRHLLRLVVLGEPYRPGGGMEVAVGELVVFQGEGAP